MTETKLTKPAQFGSLNGQELPLKRLGMKAEFTISCPACGKENADSVGDKIHYPVVGEPFNLSMWCESCEHEWSIPVVLTMSLQVVGEGLQ